MTKNYMIIWDECSIYYSGEVVSPFDLIYVEGTDEKYFKTEKEMLDFLEKLEYNLYKDED